MVGTGRSRQNEFGFECDGCGDRAVTFPHTVTYGEWDDESSNYRHPPRRRDRYCRSCWREDFSREKACYWDVSSTSGARVFEVLSAADGELVADSYALTIGGRGFARVVGGEVESIAMGREARRDPDVLEFYPFWTEMDREGFEELFGGDSSLDTSLDSGSDTPLDTGSDTSLDSDSDSDRLPLMVLLRPASETPFAEPERIEPCHRRERDGAGGGGGGGAGGGGV